MKKAEEKAFDTIVTVSCLHLALAESLPPYHIYILFQVMMQAHRGVAVLINSALTLP